MINQKMFHNDFNILGTMGKISHFHSSRSHEAPTIRVKKIAITNIHKQCTVSVNKMLRNI